MSHSAENGAPPTGTPRGTLRWACAECGGLLVGAEHREPPADSHAPVRILTRDIPPGPCPDTGMPVESCLCMTHDPDGAHFRTTRNLPSEAGEP